MVELDDFAGIVVKKAVGLGVHGVADEDAFVGMSKDFGVVPVLDEYKGMTANFTKVRERSGFTPNQVSYGVLPKEQVGVQADR